MLCHFFNFSKNIAAISIRMMKLTLPTPILNLCHFVSPLSFVMMIESFLTMVS